MMPKPPQNILDPSITVNVLYQDWPAVQSYFIQNYYEYGKDYSVVRLDKALTVIRFYNKPLYQDFLNKWHKVIVHIDSENIPPEA